MRNSIALSLFLLMTFTCLSDNINAKDVLPLSQQIKSADWYAEQTEEWSKILQKDSENAKAWYNYYLACRYVEMMYQDKAKDLDLKSPEEILQLMEKYVPDSFEYNLLKFKEINDFSSIGLKYLTVSM